MSKIPLIKLADGNLIPQIGLGLWQITDEVKFKDSFKAAVSAGYRHFDSAQAYGNEQFLGDAVRRSCEDNKLKRSDFFITTKIAVQNFGDKKSIDSVKKSLQKLGMEYVDLLLLHFPVPVLRKKTWQAAEKTSSVERVVSKRDFVGCGKLASVEGTGFSPHITAGNQSGL